ncbi:MAG: hypothetical protein EZS28_005912 [Streblomastix strix]|uniref:Uncharacterized protein n=1 Tax=Streblomastix strix TaxID=222440 RepID=A0A5J4WU64_9EUKA|nr:MAG: hypothetical protein EZS28_005912 [Streblomastix strix]
MNQLFELQREIEIMNIIGDKMKKFAELHKLIIGMDENDIQASINQNFFIWLKDHFFSSQYIIQLEIITMLQDIIYRGEQISPSKKKSIFFRPLNRSRFLWGIHILINKQAEIQEKSKDQQYEDSEFMQKCLDVLFGVMRERYMVEEQLREICGKVLIHCLNKLITYLIEASKTLKTQPHLGIMTSNRFSDEMRRGIQTLHTLSCATQNKITQNFLVEKFRIHEAITPLLHINCDYLACEHRIQLPFSLKLEKLQLAILDAVSSLCEKDEVIQAYLVQEVRLIPHLSQILITFASQLCPNFKQSKFENFQSSPQSIQSPLQQPETIEQLKQSETSDKSNTSHTNPIQHSTSTQSPQSQNSSQPSGTAAIRITQQLYYAVLELLEYILDGNRLSAEGICFEPSLVSAFAALSQVQRKQSNQFILDEQVAVEIRIRSIWYLRQVQMNGGDKVQRSLVKDGIYTKRVLTDAISSSGGNSEDCVDVIKESLFGLTQLIMTLREGNSICQGQTTLLELVTEQLEEEGAVQEVDAQVFCTKELITSGVRATAIQTQTRLIFYI